MKGPLVKFQYKANMKKKIGMVLLLSLSHITKIWLLAQSCVHPWITCIIVLHEGTHHTTRYWASLRQLVSLHMVPGG